MKRLPHFEAGLMTYVASHEAHIHDNGPYPDTANAEAQRSNEAPSFRPPALEDAYRIGRMLRVMLNQNLTGKLSRYEVTLQNQLTQTIRELRKLQDERQRRATVPKDRRIVEEAALKIRNGSMRSKRAGRADRARSRLGAFAVDLRRW